MTVLKAVKHRVVNAPISQGKGIVGDAKRGVRNVGGEVKSQVLQGRPTGWTANLGGIAGREPSLVKAPIAIERNVVDSVRRVVGRVRSANRQLIREITR